MPSSNRCTNTLQYMGVWALVTTQFEATVNVNYFDASGKEINGANYKLTKNSSKRIKLTTAYMDLDNKNGEQPEFKACHIKSTAPVSVQYYTTGPNSCGMYLALPNNALGQKYVVMTFPSNPGVGQGVSGYACPLDSSSSEFMVIAPYDNTTVAIHNTGLTIAGRKGIAYGKDPAGGDISFTQKLMRGQVYMVKATKDDPSNSEEGSYIESDKPVVVLAAQENAVNGIPGINSVLSEDIRDLMIEEMMPVEYWDSKDYFSMPFRDSGPRNNDDGSLGEQYRVYAMGADKVNFNIDQAGNRQLPIGRFNNFARVDNVETGVNIASDQGALIGVEMFDYRQQNTNQPFPAPSQMNVVPAARWKKNYAWMVPDDQIIAVRNYFVNIIAPKDSMSKIKIATNGGAGTPVTSFPTSGSFAAIPGRPDLQGRRITLAPGSYALSGNTPCVVYTYGMEAFDLNGDLGDNEGDDYYFSYAAPVGQTFGHDGGKPSILVKPDCADWQVTVTDTLPIDGGLATIELLNDPDGIYFGKPIVSTNVRFRPLDYELIPGSTKEQITIEITNPLKDAYAALYIVNRAGKDTMIELFYKAPQLTLTKGVPGTPKDQDSIGFPVTLIHDQVCSYFTLKNTSAKGGKPFLITGVDQILHDPDIKISGTIPAIPKGGLTLNPGDTLQIGVCYTASDTGVTHLDTVVISTDCFRAPAIVTGSGNTPLIQATDWNYGEVLVGDTACHTVKVTNKGTAPLTLDKNYILPDGTNFSLADPSVLPKTLKPGESINILICFHPVATADDTTTVTWTNDIRDPFKGQIKDYSGLFGRGIQKGLKWDRLVQTDTVICSDSKVIRVNLLNTATAITSVDSVVFHGPDAAQYKIIGDQLGYDPLARFSINPTDSIWVDVQFTPNLDFTQPNPYADRHSTLVAYGENGTIIKTIDFSTMILHAELHPQAASVDFGEVPLKQDGYQYITFCNPGSSAYHVDKITIDSAIFTVDSGLTIGQIVDTGACVTVKLKVNSAVEGPHTGNLYVDDNAVCYPMQDVPLKVLNPNLDVTFNRLDYDSIFVGGLSDVTNSFCDQHSDLNVFFKNLGYTKVHLRKMDIYDDPTQSGTGYSFEFGFKFDTTAPVHTQIVDSLLKQGDIVTYPVRFLALTADPATAIIVFTLDTNGILFFDTTYITAKGRTAKAIFSAAKNQQNLSEFYTGTAGDVIDVPIASTRPLPVDQTVNGKTVNGAHVMGFMYDLRYNRDLFKFEGITWPAGVDNNASTAATSTDPNDAKFEILHVVGKSSGAELNPENWGIAHLRVMLTTSTTSNFEILRQATLDASGNIICYVDAEEKPGTFQYQNACGDSTIRNFMSTGNPPVSIIEVSPNPTPSDANVTYNVDQNDTKVSVEIFDLLGKKVSTLVDNQVQNAGSHTVHINTKSLGNGQYVVRVSTPTWNESHIMMLKK